MPSYFFEAQSDGTFKPRQLTDEERDYSFKHQTPGWDMAFMKANKLAEVKDIVKKPLLKSTKDRNLYVPCSCPFQACSSWY